MPAQQFDDPLDFPADPDRKAKGTVKSNRAGRLLARASGILSDISDPSRLPAVPNPSEQAFPMLEGPFPHVRHEHISIQDLAVPLIQTTEHPCGSVHPPKYPTIPFKILSDRLHDFRNRFLQGPRLGQHARHRVLGGQPFFRPLPLRNIGKRHDH